MKFINELRMKMTIKVKNAQGERKWGSDVVKYKGVSLSIHDAETTTEWMVTKEEARQLNAALSSFLGVSEQCSEKPACIEPARSAVRKPVASKKNLQLLSENEK